MEYWKKDVTGYEIRVTIRKEERKAIKIMMEIKKLMVPRNLLFLLFSLVMLAMFYHPLKELMGLLFKSELYSHIILIPIVSGYFIYLKRRIIFSDLEYSYRSGITVITIGMILYFIGTEQAIKLNQNDSLALMIFSAITLLIGGVLVFYGIKSFRFAVFPLLFLFFLTPIPTIMVEKLILLLQMGSTEATYGFFKLTGVPVLREGFTFHLPGMSIEVAKQCSGIRSSIALFITSIIAGQLFLQTGWKKVVLALSIFPITIFKNGLRIVTLSLLGTYVDPRILGSELHKSGGIPFFFVALMLLAPVLFLLRKTEKKGGEGRE
jgi:exosortase